MLAFDGNLQLFNAADNFTENIKYEHKSTSKMKRKDLYCLIVIGVLALALVWTLLDKSVAINNITSVLKDVARERDQLHVISGIDALKSTHEHADIKVYINGKAMDFSQPKYQVTTSFIHFEEGLGDVVHIHAKGLTIGHLFNSLGGRITSNCMTIESQTYCSDANKVLKFYVNGKQSNEVTGYVIKDLDKYLITYGNEDAVGIKKQLDSVTDLAKKFSTQS